MTARRRIRIAAALALAAGTSAPLPAAAQEAPVALLLFDGSRSMWGNPEGERRSKLVLARDAVKVALARAEAQTRFGLVTFGHRRGADCNDVETVVRPEAGTAERIGAVLDKLSPTGRGPLTAALREAAKQLPAQPAPASVVLLHDDLDNCQLDPCTAIGDLRRANPRVIVHVVSIGMRREEAARMACLPKATGGRHWEATGAAQVTTAIDEALRLAAAAPGGERRPAAPAAAAAAAPAPPAPAAVKAVEQRPGLRLAAVLAEGGQPLDARVRWRVAKRGEAAPVWEGDAATPLLELPAGHYDVEAWLGFVRAKGTVEVAAGAAQSLLVPLGAGLLQLPGPVGAVPAEVARALADVVLTVKRVDPTVETIAYQRGLARDLALVPGSYIVGITAGSLRLERTLGIKSGQTTAFDPALAFGVVEITPVALADGQGAGGALVMLFEDDPESPQGRREVWRSAASPATVIMPAGTYYLVARRGTAEARERITVKAGELDRRTIVLDLARLAVQARLAGGRIEAAEPVVHRLERLDGERETAISSEPQAVFHVAAGRYRLETRVGLANAAAVREIDLKAGGREQLVLDLAAGIVRLRWLEQAGGNPLVDVTWEVREAGGKVVWSGSQTEARPLLLAGRYTVRAEARDKRLERTLDLRAGEVRTLELVGQ